MAAGTFFTFTASKDEAILDYNEFVFIGPNHIKEYITEVYDTKSRQVVWASDPFQEKEDAWVRAEEIIQYLQQRGFERDMMVLEKC